MVNPRDGADASRDKTNEILTVYLVNRSAFVGRIRIKMIYSQIKKRVGGKVTRSTTYTEDWRETVTVNDRTRKKGKLRLLNIA